MSWTLVLQIVVLILVTALALIAVIGSTRGPRT